MNLVAARDHVKVSVRVNRGLLQLHWTYPAGEKRYLSVGLSDTIDHRRLAEWRAGEIEKDIYDGCYDSTLAKYKGRSRSQSQISVATRPPPALPELWAAFVEYRSPSLSPTTLHGQYRHYTRNVARCPYGLAQADQIRAWALKEFTYDSARRWLVALNAMGEWAAGAGVVEVNPFAQLKISKKKGESNEIDPFSPAERDQIIEAFKVSRQYSYYWRLVQFLAFSGCRPSEAIALRWQDVGVRRDSLTFEQAATVGEDGRVLIKAGLKSQLKRKIPLSDKLRESIGAPLVGADSPLVFPAVYGGLIHWSNFQRRGWYSVIESIPDCPRKNPYQLRHCYITSALAAGVSPQDVAKLVGNSAEVIYRNYAGVSRILVQPDL